MLPQISESSSMVPIEAYKKLSSALDAAVAYIEELSRPNEMAAALAEATELSHRYRSDAERLIAAGAGLREVASGSAPFGERGGIREWDRAVEEARRPA